MASYNGWSNYETWCLALWIDNEESSQDYWREVTKETWESAEATSYATRRRVACCEIAERLQEEMEEAAPDLGATLWADLLGSALCEVEWQVIADNWLAEFAGDEA